MLPASEPIDDAVRLHGADLRACMLTLTALPHYGGVLGVRVHVVFFAAAVEAEGGAPVAVAAAAAAAARHGVGQ